MIKIDDKTKVGDIPHGTKVSCKIDGSSCEAVFVRDGDYGFLLQNKRKGGLPTTIAPGSYGKMFSWSLWRLDRLLASAMKNQNVTDFKIISLPEVKAPKKKKHTYHMQFQDDDGMLYTEDKIGTWTIAALEDKIKELRADANRKSARLRIHTRLFKKG